MSRTALLLTFALYLGACGGETGVGGGAGDRTPSPRETLTAEPSPSKIGRAVVLDGWRRCTNPVHGYSIAYPVGWHTGSVDASTRCRWFDRKAFELERQSEPPLTAMTVNPTARSFDRAAESVGDEGRRLTREKVTVAGHEAIRFEVEVTDGALYPDGTRRYGYVVKHPEGTALYVQTIALPNAGTDYAQNGEIVDTAVRTLTFDADA